MEDEKIESIWIRSPNMHRANAPNAVLEKNLLGVLWRKGKREAKWNKRKNSKMMKSDGEDEKGRSNIQVEKRKRAWMKVGELDRLMKRVRNERKRGEKIYRLRQEREFMSFP